MFNKLHYETELQAILILPFIFIRCEVAEFHIFTGMKPELEYRLQPDQTFEWKDLEADESEVTAS